MFNRPKIMIATADNGVLKLEFTGPAIGNREILQGIQDEADLAKALPYLHTPDGVLVFEMQGDNTELEIKTDRFPSYDLAA